eukprot:scaffold533_cov369-Prasinococcus_capsulatus_cf.AAC.17
MAAQRNPTTAHHVAYLRVRGGTPAGTSGHCFQDCVRPSSWGSSTQRNMRADLAQAFVDAGDG